VIGGHFESLCLALPRLTCWRRDSALSGCQAIAYGKKNGGANVADQLEVSALRAVSATHTSVTHNYST
jgi:hypothetical protein